jgi:hypothetical protein
VYVVDTDVDICVPPLYILYPVTPTASVEAVQEMVAPVWVMELDVRDVGILGAVVSLGAGDPPVYSYAPISQEEPRELPSLSVEKPKELKLAPILIAGLEDKR